MKNSNIENVILGVATIGIQTIVAVVSRDKIIDAYSSYDKKHSPVVPAKKSWFRKKQK